MIFPMFSSQHVTVLGFLCWSMIDFKLTFAESMRFKWRFIVFHTNLPTDFDVQFSYFICIEDCPSPLNNLCIFCQKSIGHVGLGLYLDYPFCSIDLWVYAFANIPLSYLLHFIVSLKRVIWFFQLYFPFSKLL